MGDDDDDSTALSDCERFARRLDCDDDCCAALDDDDDSDEGVNFSKNFFNIIFHCNKQQNSYNI